MTVAETVTGSGALATPGLIPLLNEAAEAATILRGRAIEAVAAKVSSGGKIDGGALLPLEQSGIDLAAWRDLGGDGFDGAAAQDGGGLGRLIEERNKVGRGERPASRQGFGDSQDRLLA